MTKRLFGAAIALVIMGVAPAAFANTKHPVHVGHNAIPASGLKSFVDVNNDGKFSKGDTALPPQVAPGVEVIDLTSNGDRGAVIGGNLAATTIVRAAGDVHVTSDMDASKLLEIISFGDIWVDAGVHLKASMMGLILQAPNGTVHIGDGATLDNGNAKNLSIQAHSIVVGSNVKLVAQGQDAGMTLTATAGATFGTGDQFLTDNSYDNSSNVSIADCGGLSIDHATIKAENMEFNAGNNCADGAVAVTNSSLELNTYSNAGVDIKASSFDHTGTTITPAGVQVNTFQ